MNFYEFIGIGWVNSYPDWVFKWFLGVTKKQYAMKYLGYTDADNVELPI